MITPRSQKLTWSISNQQAGLRNAVMSLAEQNRHFGGARGDDISGLKDELQSTISSPEEYPSHGTVRGAEYRVEELKDFLESWTSRANSLQKEQEIIRSLHFDDMPYRRDTILDAWAETFRWVHEKRLHFEEWLRADEGVYWISGYAGSGKSTLIKYLSTDNTTHQQLLKWAGPKKLVKSSFHFWFSGSDLQKSQEGLLRSLLFEIFRQCPSVIPSACPERWEDGIARPWTRQELMQTLQRLKLHSPETKFCFFIDGLDEYQDRGRSPDRGEQGSAAFVDEIIETIAILSKLRDVKICLSSRPWQAFEQAYGACATRKLYVDRENREDIRRYVRDKFKNSDALGRTQEQSNASEITDIVNEIVDASQGVFLWVALVTESLLRGLANKDRTAQLRSRLAETPKTLNGMFERMLLSVEDRYHEEAAQILQIALHAHTTLKIFAYANIGDHEHNALRAPIRTWSHDECIVLAEATETRLKVRCPDLIKIRNCMEPGEPFDAQANILVDFLHRTVEDFLSLEDTQARLKGMIKGTFNPGQYICEALLSQIKAADTTRAGQWTFDSFDCDALRGVQGELSVLLDHVKKEEFLSGVPQKALLDELNSVMTLQGWQDSRISFLGLMTSIDLQLYVKEYLPEAIRRPDGKAPLLECALDPPSEYSAALSVTGLPLREMVSLLLVNGANPNEKSTHEQTTVWEHFLKEMYRKRPARQGKKIGRKDTISFAIIQTMLEHGADPYVRCIFKARNGDCNDMDLVEMLRSTFEVESIAHLEALTLYKRQRLQEELETASKPETVSRESSWGLTFGVQRLFGWS